MPCILKVRIVAARNLPVMDRATELTDAFVEVKFAAYDEFRTQICKRTLNPVWNEDFRFEVSDDADLQNEPLELKVMDYDQITYNDSIGTVFIDMNPLLTWDSKSQISGWIPIFDTLRGVRGELNVQVRLQFFGDVNPFKDSSAGVQFYTSTALPSNLNVQSVLGFVSALENEDDPEYHWSDNFRTPRTSNESRTRVMYRLSGQLRRKIGKEALELNGNAVIGYKQYFDIENEERSITARAIGTAVRLVIPDEVTLDRGASWASLAHSPTSSPLGGTPFSESLPVVTVPTSPNAHASALSLSEDGSSLHRDQTVAMLLPTAATGYKSAEHVTFTLHNFPSGSILGIGGLVSATSVKVIDNSKTEIREAWWTELRDEIKSHARALGCPFVIGYTEDSCINGELAVLHCSGTAAIMDMAMMGGNATSEVLGTATGSAKRESVANDAHNGTSSVSRRNSVSVPRDAKLEEGLSQGSLGQPRGSLTGSEFRETFWDAFAKRRRRRKRAKGCQACHITYRRDDSPFPMSYIKCGLCKKKYVPEVLLTTIDPPPELETVSNGILLEAHVCRYRRIHGDSRPGVISEAIPFAQYDIHRQLIYKLRINGLNAVFGLKIQFSVGESLMTAVATGTATYVRALPAPPPLKVFRNLEVVDEEDQRLLEIQRGIMARSEENRKMIEDALELLEEESLALKRARRQLDEDEDEDEVKNRVLKTDADDSSSSGSGSDSDSDDEQEQTKRHRSVIVQIDDEQDEDLVLLQSPSFPSNFAICNTSVPPSSDTLFEPHGLDSVQGITMIKHAMITGASHHPNRQLAGLFRQIYEELIMQLGAYFEKCVVAGLDYNVTVVKECEIQIVLNGVALGSSLDYATLTAETDTIELDEVLEEIRSGNLSSSRRPSIVHAVEDPMPKKLTISSPLIVREATRLFFRREPTVTSMGTSGTSIDEDFVFSIDADDPSGIGASVTSTVPPSSAVASPGSGAPPISTSHRPNHFPNFPSTYTGPVPLTPLWYIPSHPTLTHLGRISHHFVKEAAITFDSVQGGMGGFSHTFLMEIHAVLRAHARALGGNALVGVRVDLSVVEESLKGGTGYALICIGGDVVVVEDGDVGVEGGYASVGARGFF
ncbi:uncharacterized protein EV422DRAFT_519983 [Fimicolochytrium jonesii]|uniref:uncharacterized protein n=1 Tax=Fimicolochytrium jonesii TaxID=1396493 RepID=UPI0022FF36FF|nr:uncharacterized protein EV422DRAFT_519983 [Fimicolochytrium jonesii]KAI8824408.1 hypothetical protein EV422DRAFT_519983 [Fimicolochytrium jonesii]